MSTPEDNVKLNNKIQKVKRELEYMKELDQKKRKHGENFIIKRMQVMMDEMEEIVLGTNCEFLNKETKMCPILDDYCDVINKETCVVAIKERQRIEELNPRQTMTFFVRIDKTNLKKVEDEN